MNKNPVISRLVRIESKLHTLAVFNGVNVAQLGGGNPDPTPYSEADVTRALVRIESKLQSLMLHEGLNPHERKSGAA